MKRRIFTPAEMPPPPPGYVAVPLDTGGVMWMPENGPSPEALRRVAELQMAAEERLARKQREQEDREP